MRVEIRISAPLIYWRGPSPFHFITVPPKESAKIKTFSRQITYGWGVIPVQCHVGNTRFTTSLFPRDSVYLIPIKTAVRNSEQLEIGDRVTVALTFNLGQE